MTRLNINFNKIIDSIRRKFRNLRFRFNAYYLNLRYVHQIDISRILAQWDQYEKDRAIFRIPRNEFLIDKNIVDKINNVKEPY